jgi:hypothetical protein
LKKELLFVRWLIVYLTIEEFQQPSAYHSHNYYKIQHPPAYSPLAYSPPEGNDHGIKVPSSDDNNYSDAYHLA